VTNRKFAGYCGWFLKLNLNVNL